MATLFINCYGSITATMTIKFKCSKLFVIEVVVGGGRGAEPGRTVLDHTPSLVGLARKASRSVPQVNCTLLPLVWSNSGKGKGMRITS